MRLPSFGIVRRRDAAALAAALTAGLASPQAADAQSLVLLGVWADPNRSFAEGFSEIVAYDPSTEIVFSTNGEETRVDRIDISDPSAPMLLGSIDFSAFGGINSVAFKNGVGVAALEASTVTDPGSVVFFDAAGNLGQAVTVGALPDMVTFNRAGNRVLVANEGEPDGGVDPEGSVSVIDIATGTGLGDPALTATTLGFTMFNGQEAALRTQGVRIFPGVAAANDFEPEYIAVSPDDTMAFVTLQEANTVAKLDLVTLDENDTVLLPLGLKDHGLPGNGLDASDRDGAINIANWPVFGMYMPDSVASFEAGGQTYFVTANEGDARDEDDRVVDLVLDPTAFPNAASLQQQANLGRLEVSTIDGDSDGDGDVDQLFAYGARSFTIWDADGNRIYDSADDFEQITALHFPDAFNSNNDENDSFDSRSDAKGPEPEALTIGVKGGRTFAFIGLERIGGIMVYDITDPLNVMFQGYVNDRDFALTDAQLGANESLHLGPEGFVYVAGSDSPTGQPLLIAANEISGTVSIYTVPLPSGLALSLLGFAVLGLVAGRRRTG